MFLIFLAQPGHEGGHHEGGHHEGGEPTPSVDESVNRPQDGDGNENRPVGEDGQPIPSVDQNGNVEGGPNNGTETGAPQKKGMSWLPIIIIAAGIVGLLLIGLAILFIRKRRTAKGYAAPPGEAAGQPKSPARA
jgi:hypothetical protein